METLDMTFEDEKDQTPAAPEENNAGDDTQPAAETSGSSVQTVEAPKVEQPAEAEAEAPAEPATEQKPATEVEEEDDDEPAPHAGLALGVTLKDPAKAEAPAGLKTDDALARAQREAAEKEGKKPRALRKRWYIVHTYSGHENKVKVNLERRIESMGMGEKIFRVEVPQKTVTKIKDSKRYEKEERIFPGYVLVEMIMDDDSWYVVRHTPGVTKFVGSQKKPIPAKDAEIKRILMRNAPTVAGTATQRVEIDLKVGEVVKIISGPFADFEGTVTEVSPEKERLKASVSIFGRETPVELAFNQVIKAD